MWVKLKAVKRKNKKMKNINNRKQEEQNVQKEAEMEVEEEEEVKWSLFAEYYIIKLVSMFNSFNTEAECTINSQKPVVSYISMMRWRSWTHF